MQLRNSVGCHYPFRSADRDFVRQSAFYYETVLTHAIKKWLNAQNETSEKTSNDPSKWKYREAKMRNIFNVSKMSIYQITSVRWPFHSFRRWTWAYNLHLFFESKDLRVESISFAVQPNLVSVMHRTFRNVFFSILNSRTKECRMQTNEEKLIIHTLGADCYQSMCFGDSCNGERR